MIALAIMAHLWGVFRLSDEYVTHPRPASVIHNLADLDRLRACLHHLTYVHRKTTGQEDQMRDADERRVDSSDVLDEAGSGLAEFANGLGGPPALAEFAELLGWAMPMNSDATDGTFTEPMKFKATLKGNKSYRSDAPSRIPELDDPLFEDARDHLGVLAERMRSAGGAAVTPPQLASAILQVLRSGRIILSDVELQDIRKLTADVPKRRIATPKPRDALAIPARNDGYHPAVVLAN
jgi:hypothetical protein